MAVKWIGQVADELGMSVYTAIELLASQQSYPTSGLLDEDRVLLLKRFREGRLADESTGRLRLPEARPEAPAPLEASLDAAQALATAPIEPVGSQAGTPPPLPSGAPAPPPVPPPLPFRGMNPHDETTGPTTAFRTDLPEERTVIIQPIQKS